MAELIHHRARVDTRVTRIEANVCRSLWGESRSGRGTSPAAQGIGGVNYKGEAATTPGGTLQRADRFELGVDAIVSTLLPGYRQAQQIAEGGATPYDASNLFNVETKPGQPHSTQNAVSDLFKPVRLYGNRRLKKSPGGLTVPGLTAPGLTAPSLKPPKL